MKACACAHTDTPMLLLAAGTCRKPGLVCSYCWCSDSGADHAGGPGSGEPEAARGVALCNARSSGHTASSSVAVDVGLWVVSV